MVFKSLIQSDFRLDDSVSSTLNRTIKLVAICILTIGIVFRFANLDLKPYWLDEAFTSLRLSGYSDTEVIQQLDRQILTVQDLQKYQQPTSEKNSFHTIEQLAIREPQLTPLYFVILRGWVQIFGSSITTIRSLSAFFSVLAFPCLYWLCLELFRSRRIAWMSIALFAISPIQLIYAQEARPSSLWIPILIFACAALLRALREPSGKNWIIYALSISIGLYAHLFTALLSIAHAVYMLLHQRSKMMKFSVSSIVAWFSFLPWIVFGLAANYRSMSGQSQAAPLKELIKGWFRGISLTFVDLSINEASPRLMLVSFLVVFAAILGFVGLSLYLFSRSAPPSAKVFTFSLILVPFVFLIASDLATSASRSAIARYLFPAYLGIQLVVAYVLATRIGGVKLHKAWVSITASVLLVGLISCGLYTSTDAWWNKAEANTERQLAQIVNQTSQPLIITDDYFVRLLSLSHSLRPEVKVQVLKSSIAPNIPQGFSDVFLYRPSASLQQELSKTHQLESLQSPLMWKLK